MHRCLGTSSHVLAAVLLVATTSLHAQPTLGPVVSGAGGSQLQIDTGVAVQSVCGQLNSQASSLPQGSAVQSLYFRCQEMVHTSNGIAVPGSTTQLSTHSLGLSPQELARAMQQLTGEENGSKTRLATETSNGQFANIGLRLDAIARGVRATTGGLATAGRDVGEVGGNAGDPNGDGGGWGWFATGAFGFGDRDATPQEDEYEYDSSGLTFGADYQLSGGLVLGAALGLASFDADFEDLSGNTLASTAAGGGIEVDGYSLSFYGVAQPRGRLTIDGVLIYGTNDYDSTRNVVYRADSDATGRGQGRNINGAMTGSTDSSQWAAGLNVGTSFKWGATTLYLDGGLTHLDGDVDGYTEVGPSSGDAFGLNLQYDEQSITSTQARLGLHLTRAFSRTSSVISPFLQLEYRHEFENDAQVFAARYAAAAGIAVGSNFDLRFQTDEPVEDFGDIGVGVVFVLKNNFQLVMDYHASVGIDDVSANLVSFSFRGGF